jgi:hypothetical protein
VHTRRWSCAPPWVAIRMERRRTIGLWIIDRCPWSCRPWTAGHGLTGLTSVYILVPHSDQRKLLMVQPLRRMELRSPATDSTLHRPYSGTSDTGVRAPTSSNPGGHSSGLGLGGSGWNSCVRNSGWRHRSSLPKLSGVRGSCRVEVFVPTPNPVRSLRALIPDDG